MPPGARYSEIARMELSPGITVIVRGGADGAAGELLSLYRSRVMAAVLSDSELIGRDRAERRHPLRGLRWCPRRMPRAREYRIDLTLVVPLRVSSWATCMSGRIDFRIEERRHGRVLAAARPVPARGAARG